MRCYFAKWADDPCRGVLDRCHIIPKQTIIREWRLANPERSSAWTAVTPLTATNLAALLEDERNIVLACRHHHSNADFGPLDYAIPDSVYAFAGEYEQLDHYLPSREAA